MKRFLNFLLRLELLFLIILVPIWVVRPELVWVFFLPLVFWGIGYVIEGQFFPKSLLDRPILGLSILSLASLIITPVLETSLTKVIGVFLGIFFYYAFIRAAKGLSAVRIVVAVILVFIGMGIVLLGLIGGSFPNKIPVLAKLADLLPEMIMSIPGAESGFHPNAISGTLILFFPLTFVFLLRWKFIKQRFSKIYNSLLTAVYIFVVLGFAVESFYLLAGQSRGAWVGLFFGVLIVTLWSKYPRLEKPLIYMIPGLNVALYLIIVLSRTLHNRWILILQNQNLHSTIGQRLVIWEWATKVFEDFPLTGVGYNVFRLAAPVLYPRSQLIRTDFSHAHNFIFDVGVSLGVGGMLMLLWMWVIYTRFLLIELHSRKGEGKYMYYGLLIGWLAFFAFSLMDTIPLGSKLGLLFWFFMAFGQILARSTSSDNIPQINPRA
ncbi:MAG: O-antigen ligase family protein [Chloroflexota bacterium]